MGANMTQRVPYRCVIRQRPVIWHVWVVVAVCVASLLGLGATTPLCSVTESVNITDGVQDADGSIEHEGVRYDQTQYYRDEDSAMLRGCICLVRQCIHICCPDNMVSGEPCPSAELNVNFSSTLAGETTISSRNLLLDSGYHLIYAKPDCSGLLLTLFGDEYVLRTDGQIEYGKSLFSYRHYCLQADLVEPLALAGYCETVDALAMHRMYSIGILVSLPFLVVTFIVYALLPEMQNIPGKSLMCYVASLTVAYLLTALIRLNVYSYRSNWCIATGFIMYVSLLASFFWLNVMAFDIFWTFGGSRGRSSDRRKFLYYSLYGWGAPLLMLAFVLVADYTEFLHESRRPNIGKERCFVDEEMMVGFLYMFLPMLLLVGANVLFFAVTAIRIFRMEQATASALSGESRRHTKYEKDRYRFSLYLRLFIIMGVTWTMEIISWLIGGSSWLIYLVDMSNALTGIFIFVLFVWKQKVKEQLCKRFGIAGPGQRNENQTNSITSTTRTTDVKANANTDVYLSDMTHGN